MTLLVKVLQSDTIKVMIVDNQKSFLEITNIVISITAIVAIIISVLGLIYTVRYNRKTLTQTKEHNKKSVEPILGTPFTLFHDQKSLKLEIENFGLGTAFIRKFSILYENETIYDFTELIRKLDRPSEYKIRYYKFPASTHFVPISANSKICIFDYTYTDLNQYYKMKALLKKCKYNIEYETMYGEKRMIDNHVY